MSEIFREVRLVSRPDGFPTLDNFEIKSITLEVPGPGEVQVRNTWMSVDPYMGGRMRNYESYLPSFEIRKPLQGTAVGTVVKSNDGGLKEGDTVLSMMGWREAFNALGKALRKVDVEPLAPEAYLGICGNTGLSAHVGLLDIAKIKAGEVIFASAAAGAVGSAACQIARIKGARVIDQTSLEFLLN